MKLTTKMGIHGHFKLTFINAKTGKIRKIVEVDNLVVNTGINAYAAIANNEGLTTGWVNYLAIGTGTNVPAITDTTLQTEVARTLKASSTRTNNQVVYEFAFGTGSGNGSLKEVGTFIDGTSSANTGTMVDRASIDEVKTSADILNVTFTLTFA